MIVSLSIKNYALIKELYISFDSKLTVITGETGAGKSILLGALSLILGERSNTEYLHNNKNKCIVEGEFFISNYNLRDFFDQNDLDYNDHTVIRREINSKGRSRGFINDTPVSIGQLKRLASKLVDINSQHQILLLNEQDFQLKLIDSFCNHEELLNSYSFSFNNWKQKKILLSQLKSQELNQKSDLDYKHFLFNELRDAQLNDEGELIRLEEELKILENSEEIELKLKEVIHISDQTDNSIISEIKNIKNLLFSISNNHPSIGLLAERIDVACIELQDVISEAEQILDRVDHDSDRIDVLLDRTDVINRLLQKHKVGSVNELLQIQIKLEEELNNVKSLREEIEELEKEVKEFYDKANVIANKITKNRTLFIPEIESKILALLQTLGIPHAQIQIKQTPNNELDSNGKERVLFYFSANKGSELKEVSSIASGGELSRLMLCIKYLIAKKKHLPTIIFDEIDSGVSGEIAHKMGVLMKNIGSKIQVISITHLPQVAAIGNSHLLVKKDDSNLTTETIITLLDNDGRVQELAKMLSGKEITKTSLINAQELLNA